jgi:signal transduction histidine kinase
VTSIRNFLAGGGEMGERMRSLDWSRTALGPVEGWPQSLRSAVSICVGSRFPIVLYWGPHRVVLYNDAYAEILGKKHPGALGRPCREVWSEIWDLIAPMLDGVVATGQATWSQDQFLPLERRGYPEECYFSFSFSPVRGEEGAVEGIFTAVIESTGRVVGERRLALLRDLAARNAAARSPREACALSMETLAANGKDIVFACTYVDGELQACTPGAEDRLAAASAELVKELPVGRAGRLIVGINPQRPFDDACASFLGLVASQIATALANALAYEEERKRAEALAELDRAKTAFFSNVSHELRTPLTLMLGPVEDALADAEAPLPAAQRERLELARRSALRLQKLVNTLLDFSRIEAGRAQASYAPTDLGALTADLAASFRSAIEKAGLKLTVECPPLAEPAYVDRDMWEKIVLNLLSNAFKFTFEGEIELGLRRTASHFELRVRDTGTGIPAAELPHVFERFRRVEGAKSRTHEGTGIGLALVLELAKLHGGTIGAQSVEGKGSTFTVSIPAGHAHLPAERIGAARELAPTTVAAEAFVEEARRWIPDAAEHGAPAPAPARARIVWADDNADMREYVRKLLSTRYEVQAVADGEAALAAVRARPTDLVLTDVMMPKLDGLGLLRALRADPQTSTIPMIVLSARAGEEGRIEGLDAGADDYLTKPFSARELLARVAACLETARIRRDAEQALRDADRRKDEFMAMLAHELRNPLSAIALGADLLKRARLDDPKARFAAPAIERQAKQLQRLADDMLDMARATYGKLTLKKERVDLLAAAKAAATHAAAKKVKVCGESAWVEGDAARVQQMIGNLIENAVKYGGRRIRVEVSRTHGRGRLSVQDDGQGIAPALLPDLFKPFVQGSQALDRAQGGLGLGLALVERLAALHGGNVAAHSDGPGKGATFTISLPAAPGPAAGAKKASSARVADRRRVLVVEDEKDVREMLKVLLESEGHEVSIAEDGVEGLAKFGSFRPDVALVDIGLPGMDGYELARQARSLPHGNRFKLVAITGYGQDKDRQRARDAGFDLHVTKPVMYEQLVRAFESWPRS